MVKHKKIITFSLTEEQLEELKKAGSLRVITDDGGVGFEVHDGDGRKYLPTLAELIDRLSILQLKEVFISENKDKYAEEIQEIMHDIDLSLKEETRYLDVQLIDAKLIRDIIVLAQFNEHIWYNESEARKGGTGNLKLTHSLNGIRNRAKNRIQDILEGGRKDYKVDCLAAEHSDWEPSWGTES